METLLLRFQRGVEFSIHILNSLGSLLLISKVQIDYFLLNQHLLREVHLFGLLTHVEPMFSVSAIVVVVVEVVGTVGIITVSLSATTVGISSGGSDVTT